MQFQATGGRGNAVKHPATGATPDRPIRPGGGETAPLAYRMAPGLTAWREGASRSGPPAGTDGSPNENFVVSLHTRVRSMDMAGQILSGVTNRSILGGISA